MRYNLLILAIIVHRSMAMEWYEHNNPHFLNGPEILEMQNNPNQIKMFKFFSPNCGYCRFLKTFVDNYKNQHTMEENFNVYEINCQNNMQICLNNYQVRAYPATIFFNEEGAQIQRFNGVYAQQIINNYMNKYNEMAKEHSRAKIEAEVKEKLQDVVNQKVQEAQSQKQQPEEKKEEEKKDKQTKLNQQSVQKPGSQPQKQQLDESKKNEQQKQIKQAEERKAEEQRKKVEAAAQEKKKVEEEKQKKEEIIVEEKTIEGRTMDIHISEQKQVSPQNYEGNSSGSNIKYAIYVIGIFIAVVYAKSVLSQKNQSNKKLKEEEKSPMEPKIESEQIAEEPESEVLVEEVPDQEL